MTRQIATRILPPTAGQRYGLPGRRSPATVAIHATQVLWRAAVAGFADFSAIYSWRTWLLGWMARVLCQVAFFGVVGRLLDSQATTRYLLIGNAVLIAVMESMFVVASTTWERRAGTLSLLIASPSGPVLVFCGRSAHWLVSGTASSTITLFTLAPLLGVNLPFPRALVVVPLIGLVSVSAYCFALVLAGLALRAIALRNIIGNLAWLTISLLAGVQVPTATWPDWVRVLGAACPAQHGLTAIRTILDDGPAATAVRHAVLELVVAIGWLAVAAFTFRRLAERGTQHGSIELGG